MGLHDQQWELDDQTTLVDPSINFLPDWGNGRPRRRPLPVLPEVPVEPPPCEPEPNSRITPEPVVGPDTQEATPALADRPNGGLSGIPLALVVAASIFGGGLAVAVVDRTAPRMPGSPARGDTAMKPDVANLVALLEHEHQANEAMAERLARIEARAKNQTDTPLLAEFKGLGAKVEVLQQDARQLQPISSMVESVKKDLDQSVVKLHEDLALILKEKRSESRKPADYGAGNPFEVLFMRGISLFEQKHYGTSREVFLCLTEVAPSDARVWYYAALANAFVSNDWSGAESIALFQKGVQCERAGTPDRASIDSSFATLDKKSGKDWIDYYRSNARPVARPGSGPE